MIKLSDGKIGCKLSRNGLTRHNCTYLTCFASFVKFFSLKCIIN